ncbi:MAG: methionyl-tRNA formyltransferase [Patescibacteria group bacterium]
MNICDQKIVFMGTPEFAAGILQSLLNNNFNVVGVVTAPDRPKGRGQKIAMSEVKELALKNKLVVWQPDKVRSEDFFQKLKDILPDLIIVAAYGQIIPKKILELPKFGCINVHASLLPKYRGASPIHYVLLNGEQETGVTIMKMDEGMDTGEIISNFQFPISNKDNLISLYERLAKIGAELLVKTIPDYIAGKIELKKQDNNLASYTKIITKSDGKIDWNMKGRDIFNKIRAFNPWPGTFTNWQERKLKIHSARLTERKFSPGEVIVEDKKIYVGTDDFALEIIDLQLEGRKTVSAENFVLGNKEIDKAKLL